MIHVSPRDSIPISGVPFSWEHLPGIPKKLQNHNKEYSMKLLPLPPPTIPRTSKNNSFEDTLTRKKASAGASDSFRQVDPFFAALVECSKEDGDQATERNLWTGAKVTRSMSDRLGFINLYSSCKRSCAVSESTVYLPRSRRTAGYGLVNHRRSR
ncbi:protein disulfide-isomerase 5-2-like [Hibiscus syriacus]|uniref:Protein disulfide-isomerase 5-2-like n=1 Tax=Hibiscus syriacus TaxID=106335 RepID=A0A6A2YS10_HIBSY|nr:protein disulfide-isomerase 5-2-like [Hibiscus syriacus]